MCIRDSPYILQNYINKYLEEHPEELYHVVNDILSLLDTHSMYLSSEEYTQGFSTLEGFIGIGVGLQETAGGVQIGEVLRYSAAEEAGLEIGDLIVRCLLYTSISSFALGTREYRAKKQQAGLAGCFLRYLLFWDASVSRFLYTMREIR